MSTETLGSPPANLTVVWSSPHRNTWVGRRGNEQAGVVEFVAGHFIVAGENGAAARSFASLLDAKQSIEFGEIVETRETFSRPSLTARFTRRGPLRN
jgi:hypothetical protein